MLEVYASTHMPKDQGSVNDLSKLRRSERVWPSKNQRFNNMYTLNVLTESLIKVLCQVDSGEHAGAALH